MAHDGGDDAEGPGQAQQEHAQHQERLDGAPDHEKEEAHRHRNRQQRRHQTVVERRQHLVIRQGGSAGRAGGDIGIRFAQAPDDLANRRDELLVVREAGDVPLRLDEKEQQPIVGGEEIAGACTIGGRREHTRPRRDVLAASVEAVGDGTEQRVHEPGIELGCGAVTKAEVDESEGEAPRDFRADALEEAGEGRAGGVLLDEATVQPDRVGEIGELLRREIEQCLAREEVRVDPIRDSACARQTLDLGGKPVGIRLSPRHTRRLDRDDDVVEIAEVAQMLLEALDVEMMLRQQLYRGALKRQPVAGEAERGEREHQTDDDGEARSNGDHADHSGQRRPGRRKVRNVCLHPGEGAAGCRRDR